MTTGTPRGDRRGGLHAEVWRVLLEECNASEGAWHSFLMLWPECREYRFMGSLGFGGKVYADGTCAVRVGCYPEDRTPQRDAAIAAANQRLRGLSWRAAGVLKEDTKEAHDG